MNRLKLVCIYIKLNKINIKYINNFPANVKSFSTYNLGLFNFILYATISSYNAMSNVYLNW